jgi:ADP-heptose:LPS heptosyltransferase
LAHPLRSIAVLRPGRIGDYLCATPAVRALRTAAPAARLDYIALPLVRELVERNPHIDRYVEFPGFPGIAEQFFAPQRALSWLSAMQDEEYDLVVQLYGSGVNANPIALMMGGARCAGFIRPGDPIGLLDAAIPLPTTGAEVDRVLALVRHLGAPDAGRGYDLRLTSADRGAASGVLEKLPRPVVALHCGARDAERRAAPDAFVGAAAVLGGSAVILGGDDERAVGSALAAGLDAAGVPRRNLTGDLPLATAAAVIEAAAVLVTTDSGPAHLAYAVGAPSVTVYLASEPERWAPPVPGPHLTLDCRDVAPTAGRLAEAAARALEHPSRSAQLP